MKSLCAVLALAIPLTAQTGNKLEFDIASIKPNKSGLPPKGPAPNSIFPLGPGDVYVPNGGHFLAVNQTMLTYFRFAYKDIFYRLQYVLPQLPEWMRTERYDIEARVEGNPSKDDMRVMMQALLADRCQLKLHHETREVPVFALVLDKPGKTGRQLEPHVDDPPCATSMGKPASYRGLQAVTAHGYPVPCGGDQYVATTGIGAWREGARNVDMARVAESLQGFGRMGRPVVDRTGLSGKFDFALEWTPQPEGPTVDADAEQFRQPGPSFMEAVRNQLGLKFKEDKAPIEIVVVDHIERPSEN
jgi:uncharacterized protein (TIGR03435 family)